MVRLALCVHDVNRRGFASLMIGIARDGSNRWPAVHQFDVREINPQGCLFVSTELSKLSIILYITNKFLP
jgi:hypothetical protein